MVAAPVLHDGAGAPGTGSRVGALPPLRRGICFGAPRCVRQLQLRSSLEVELRAAARAGDEDRAQDLPLRQGGEEQAQHMGQDRQQHRGQQGTQNHKSRMAGLPQRAVPIEDEIRKECHPGGEICQSQQSLRFQLSLLVDRLQAAGCHETLSQHHNTTDPSTKD